MGFGGDCFLEPLRLEPGLEQTIHGCTYRIVEGDAVQYAVQILQNGEFSDMLGFDDIPALPADFEMSNFYTNFHPTSGFRNFLMLNRFTEEGRVSMFNLSLNVVTAEGLDAMVSGYDVTWPGRSCRRYWKGTSGSPCSPSVPPSPFPRRDGP